LTGNSEAQLAIVILNWNGVEDTLDCLNSLRESTLPVYPIVVDNGSAGDDAARIRDTGLAQEVIETGRNLGYAGGNNVGLRRALANHRRFAYICVLNNDTVVGSNCMRTLTEQLADGPETAVAPTIRYADEPGNVWFAGGVLDRGWPRHLQPGEFTLSGPLQPSEWLTGCCILARSETWARIGLFDPRYFLIFEDCEWSARAAAAGVHLAVSTEATILHKVSRSFQSGPTSVLGSFYFVRNGLNFNWTYRRRHAPQFLLEHLLAPTARAIVARRLNDDLRFRWIGTAAWLLRQHGAAPARVAKRARAAVAAWEKAR
jgi:GT2 family glycosyltransferase